MVKVRRGNVCLRIVEADIAKYMAKGFSVIDEHGNVIKKSIPTELGQLQKAFSDHEELIKAKDAEIAKLKAELKALKTAGVKKTSAVETQKTQEEEEESDSSWDDWDNAEEVEKPVKKSKKSK